MSWHWRVKEFLFGMLLGHVSLKPPRERHMPRAMRRANRLSPWHRSRSKAKSARQIDASWSDLKRGNQGGRKRKEDGWANKLSLRPVISVQQHAACKCRRVRMRLAPKRGAGSATPGCPPRTFQVRSFSSQALPRGDSACCQAEKMNGTCKSASFLLPLQSPASGTDPLRDCQLAPSPVLRGLSFSFPG